MRVEKFKDKISNLPPWVIPILIILIFRILFYLTLNPYTEYSDSFEYKNFNFSDFFNLEFTSGRTPIYSIILRVFRYLFGESYYLNFITILQGVVSLISVIFFYKACNLLIKNKNILFFSTILYGLSCSIMGWDNAILTESFALSGTAVFIYYILKYIKIPKLSYGLINIGLMFFLTFLRPTFLLFDVLLFIFWIFRMFFMKDERKILFKLSACSFIVFLFIAGYSYIFSKSHEIFSISNPIPRQNLYTVMDRGYYKSSSNQEFIDAVEKSLEENTDDLWAAMMNVLDQFGNKEIMKLTKESVNKNIELYVEDTISVASELAYSNFYSYYSKKNSEDINFLYSNLVQASENLFDIFKVGHTYLIILLELVVLIFLWIKKKDPPWVHIGIFTFIFSIVFTSYVGTNAQYDRTMICVLPFMYLSLSIFMNWLFIYSSRKQNLIKEGSLK